MSKNFTDGFKEKLDKYANYVVIGLSLLLIISLFRNVSRIRSASNLITEKQEKLDKLKKENEKLKDRLSKTQSDWYIEKQLRDSLGLAKEGEAVVVLPDDEILRSLAPDDEAKEQELPLANWQKWLQLFI